MSGRAHAVTIRLTSKRRRKLEQIIRAATSRQRLVLRARIVLAAAGGAANAAIARALGCSIGMARTWRRRFAVLGIAGLFDRPRSGRPEVHGPSARLAVLAVATSVPPEGESQWSQAMLADHLRERGLAISAATVSRVLAEAQVRPHKVRGWLNRADDPSFWIRAGQVCRLYRNPPPGTVLVSIDEKTGIQAKSRKHSDIPARPGRNARCEFEYVRHGTISILAAMNVTTGEVIAERIHRNDSQTFIAFLAMLHQMIQPHLDDALDYPADAPTAGLRLQGLTRRELAEDVLALGAAIAPAAWPQPMLGWLLSRPEPPPARADGRIQVGDSDVRAIRTTVQLFMQMDFQFGGGHARAALAQYFANDVCPLLEGRFADQVGQQLFSAASQVAELLGWTAYDIGRHGLAQRYFIQGLRLAQAANDRMMGGRLLASMSHQANYLGNFDQAVQLARAAQEGSRGAASATTMAMFLAMEARGHAGNSDDAACSRALLQAETFFQRRNVADDPDWISYFDAAELAGEGAHCFRDLRNPA